ncbi:ORF111 [Escherichia phage T5]|uniref:ORF111 n=1 Tax=Escherichia phage T5 TaxID=2695836 RepID=Q5DMI3_BPT5|nr:ORF111 [Escherichia phage T5]
MITQERLKELFDYSPGTGEFTRKVSRGNQKAGSIVTRKDSNGYIIIGIDGRITSPSDGFSIYGKYITGKSRPCK